MLLLESFDIECRYEMHVYVADLFIAIVIKHYGGRQHTQELSVRSTDCQEAALQKFHSTGQDVLDSSQETEGLAR